MARPSSQTFRCQPLAELTRQLQYAPPKRRIEQVHRTETLHDDIDPSLNYPLDFVWYRITGYRGESVPTTVLTGQAILADLRLIIDRLSQSVGIPVTDDDPAESPDHVADRLGVSTKTLSRWRALGLRWRWVVQPKHKRKTIAYTSTAVERFITNHPDRVRRAAGLTHTDPATRQEIIDKAKELSQATEASLNQVALLIAKETGRAHQTIRLILEHHERDHSDDAIFIDRTTPLDKHQWRLITRAHRGGTPIDDLAQQFQRTRTTIYRAIRQRRADAIGRLRLTYCPSPAFEQDDAERLYTQTTAEPTIPTSKRKPSLRDDHPLPEPLNTLYNAVTVDAPTQRALLTQYNYFKFSAADIRCRLNRNDPRAADIKRIEGYVKQARDRRDRVIRHNLPLILSLVRRHLIDQPDQSINRLIELLEAAMPILADAIESFDINRKQEFPSHLTWLLMRRFAQIRIKPPPPSRAQRRIDPATVTKRIRQAAANSGIRLPVDTNPAATPRQE